MIRPLKSKDRLNLFDYLEKNDYSLLNSINSIFRDIRNGKTVYISENENIDGILYLEKESEDTYVKFYADSKKIAYALVNILIWNTKTDFYCKINLNDKTGFELKKLGFRIINRNQEYFLMYYNPKNRRKR